jgi:hypothetical protein
LHATALSRLNLTFFCLLLELLYGNLESFSSTKLLQPLMQVRYNTAQSFYGIDLLSWNVNSPLHPNLPMHHSESEALVQEAIDGMISRGRGTDGHPGMTVMIVAHRLSTVRNADIIFVISEGKVIEQGSHDSLVAKPDGAYTSLIGRQMKAQQKLENGK